MELIEYDDRYRQDFIDLNKEWILNLFGFLEKEDIETFQNIEEELSRGAMIYFAVENGSVMATCMTKKVNQETWELCKLAADETYKKRGAGNAVFEKCMEYAVLHGAKKLFIISNSKLKPALHIYEKHGFRQISLKDYAYERGDIAFEWTP